ncbi:hypothetical protein P4O66_017377 [Electrophorus voltai]|uniref:Uncharacterized protein n=1 Tax=Electrophorus voltai TaxID=2609070 RepID=A0AAD8YT83_9TELE|nr:hypothetical protein P4O66_017377 [Electrophorus voltai]
MSRRPSIQDISEYWVVTDTAVEADSGCRSNCGGEAGARSAECLQTGSAPAQPPRPLNRKHIAPPVPSTLASPAAVARHRARASRAYRAASRPIFRPELRGMTE